MSDKIRVSKSGIGIPTGETAHFIGEMYIDESNGKQYRSYDILPGAFTKLVDTDITGMTTNYFPYQGTATGLTNSIMFQTGTTVTVGGNINSSGYIKDGTSLLLDGFKSGSLGAAGTIPVSNGSTSTPSWAAPLTAIGSSLTAGYIPKVGASKLENSIISESGSSVFVNGSLMDLKTTTSGVAPKFRVSNSGGATGFPSIEMYRSQDERATIWLSTGGGGLFLQSYRNDADVNSSITFQTFGANTRMKIWGEGTVSIGTTDIDGTPAIGRLTVKGSTADGSTNIFVGRDSDEANVFSIDTDGDIITSGTITASSATTNSEVINLGQLKDKVKSGSLSMVTGTWPIYFEKSFPTAGYVTSVWGINSLGVEVQIKIITQYDYGFEIEVSEDCVVKYESIYPETTTTYEDNMWYGISYDTTNSSPTLTRIGNLNLHKVLPVQNKLKACLLTDAISINYYLNPTDWTKNITGGTSNLDGTDGQVMIEKPTLYWKFETSGTTNYVKISEYPLTGYAQKPKCYIGAYEASLQRSNSKLASVVNTTTDFRGGNNTSAWDAASNSLLGKPATNYHIVNARTYARNRGTGWNQLIYDNYIELFWLFAIEYATFNSQLAVNSTLTSQGYKQGGLGNGVTTANNIEWINFNGQNPFINCGASNSLGSGSGEVSVNVTDFGGIGVTRTFTVNRYRGVENPFGHIWKFVDGLNVYNSSGTTTMYVIDNPSNLASDTQTNSRTAGVIAQVEEYGKTMLFGSSGDIVPNVTTGEITPTTYMCDYFYPNLTANSWRVALFGGSADIGSYAGFLYSYFRYSSSTARTYFGSRLSAR